MDEYRRSTLNRDILLLKDIYFKGMLNSGSLCHYVHFLTDMSLNANAHLQVERFVSSTVGEVVSQLAKNDTRERVVLETPASYLDELRHPSNRRSIVKNLYGRIDRALKEDGIVRTPTMLSTRPTKSVPFEMPFSFIMGPELLELMLKSSSLEDVLASVISLDNSTVANRLKLVKEDKLDNTLMLFSSLDVPVQPASLEGFCSLLSTIHPEAKRRLSAMLPALIELRGPDKAQQRVQCFAEYWTDWTETRECMWLGKHSNQQKPDGSRGCTCKHMSFDSYCSEYDSIAESPNGPGTDRHLLVLTREMLCMLCSCTKYYGYDGITYEESGKALGLEYISVNMPVEGNACIAVTQLSTVERFRP